MGWINFKNYFAVTVHEKHVLWFQRVMDDNKEYKVKELKLIEFTENYIPLPDENDEENPNRWMIGYSGTKMYLHNFEDLTSYILLENQSWNMRTQILTVKVEDRSGRFIDGI